METKAVDFHHVLHWSRVRLSFKIVSPKFTDVDGYV